jgi:anaerobic dimethyl sulfoxide reductase subunit C (anchor subunit)
MKELPLIIFTLAMQAAIGAYLWANIIRLRDKEAPAFKTNTLAALILSVIGMSASLVHLGKPYLALTSMFNLSSSWLSREIFFSGAFFILLVLVWWLERAAKAENILNILGWLACLTGLAAVFAMAQLYMKTIIPAWQSVNTLVDFYATTVILGALVFFVTRGQQGREKLPRLDLIILGVVLVQVAFLPNYVAGLGALAGVGQESTALLAGSYGVTMFLRWLLILGGIFLFVLSRTDKFVSRSNFLYLAVAGIIVGEIIGRYLFYVSGIPMGIGII